LVSRDFTASPIAAQVEVDVILRRRRVQVHQ
jgi:hypothetical protein